MLGPASNFDLRRSRAHCVGQIDMCCLVFGTLTIIGIFPLGVVLLYKQFDRISEGVLVYLVYSALIIFAFVAVEFYATSRLVKASSKDDKICAEKSLHLCHIWFPLNIFFLVIGILIAVIVFQPKIILSLVFCVPIRVYMICVVKNYMDALEEHVAETRPNREIHLHAIFGDLERNKFQSVIV